MDFSAQNARRHFNDLIREPGFVGFRILFSGGLGQEWLTDGRLPGGPMEWVFEAAEEATVPLAFLLTDPLPDLAQLGAVAAAHPKLPLIVDHAGAVGGPDRFVRLPELVKLAHWDNIYVKLTGLAPTTIDLEWIAPDRASPFAFMDPIIKTFVEAFGARHLMWGSDVNKYVGKRTLTEILDQFRLGCPFLSEDDRSWILGRTAAQVYRLQVRSGAERQTARATRV
jgi:predicted TIM-barrel fold metal-dependent hydrolase